MADQSIKAPRAPHPFIKWAGGKRQLLPELLCRVPKIHGRYIEPFAGGGALFWALTACWKQGTVVREGQAMLADANAELMKTYEVIRNRLLLSPLIDRLQGMEMAHSDSYFLEIRSRDWRQFSSPVDVAARFLYLNKTCFNGLYRVNRKGLFNVPLGSWRKKPTICDEENLRACHQALQGINLHTGDFRQATKRAERGDFVYMDPPYVPVSATSNFTSFTPDGFTWDDQVALADEAKRLKDLGAKVLISNSGTAKTAALYEERGFHIEKVKARRNINSAPEFRDVVVEFLIL